MGSLQNGKNLGSTRDLQAGDLAVRLLSILSTDSSVLALFWIFIIFCLLFHFSFLISLQTWKLWKKYFISISQQFFLYLVYGSV